MWDLAYRAACAELGIVEPDPADFADRAEWLLAHVSWANQGDKRARQRADRAVKSYVTANEWRAFQNEQTRQKRASPRRRRVAGHSPATAYARAKQGKSPRQRRPQRLG